MSRKFSRNLTLAFFVSLAIVFLFNSVLDPYHANGIFSGPYNSAREGFYKQMRLGTLQKLERFKPDIVAVGGSSVQFLDLERVGFHRSGKVYNLGVWDADGHEIVDFALHALENHRPKELLIGLSFAQFGKTPAYTDRRPPSDYRPKTNGNSHLWSLDFYRQYYLSREATVHSLAGLLRWGAEPGYGDNGSQTQTGLARYAERLGHDPFEYTRRHHAVGLFHSSFRWADGRQETKPQPESRWALDPAMVARLGELRAACAKHEARCLFSVTPLERTYYEMLYDLGFGNDLEQWRADLAERLGGYWDFATINSITSDRRNFIDSIHFGKAESRLIIDRLYLESDADVPPDFGVWVTQENVNAHNIQSRPTRSHPAETYFPPGTTPNYLSRRLPTHATEVHQREETGERSAPEGYSAGGT